MAVNKVEVGICFAIILGTKLQAGHDLFVDINAAFFIIDYV